MLEAPCPAMGACGICSGRFIGPLGCLLEPDSR